MSNEKHIQDLKEIRSMMEHSTRFLSLSGMSGVMAGVYALVGAYLANNYANGDHFKEYPNHQLPFLLIGLGVMAAALITGVILTYFKARKSNQTLLDKTALRMVAHIGFPMLVGAFFWLALVYTPSVNLTAGVFLIFYGLGLINGSKYTVNDIRFLGFFDVILGIIALFFPEHGLYLWAAGFGLGHIVYGTYVWAKYERNNG
ncbi:MAG: hypothetical protein COA58_12975 [Bacteroidetes bacterium]|nr:MAG: hypothetical protein COA58_12975 [Bacteroidota bacterium]